MLSLGSHHFGASQLLQVSMANCKFRSLSAASVSELFERLSLSDGFTHAPLALMIIWIIGGKR